MFFSTLLWILLLFSSASASLQYILDSMENTRATLDNQAVFQMDFWGQQAISDWEAGDIVEIFNTFPTLFFPQPMELREGLPIVVPKLRIKNITRNSENTAHLIFLPTLGSLRIISVDLPNHTVTLSDATDWIIDSDDAELLNLWNTGDYILVGHNVGLHSSIFESILLNGNQQALIRAQRQ